MLFDDWAERYDRWFTTPVGALVKEYETVVVLDFLEPGPGEVILDAGCGTGIFTRDILERGAAVTGLDISEPMLAVAKDKLKDYPFTAVPGDMLALPFPDSGFDKAVSITALEFIADGQKAVDELFRVTRPGGCVVVATLNSLGTWAARRRAREGKHVLENAFYRSPDDLLALGPVKGTVRTAVHFPQDDNPETAAEKERAGQAANLVTGAFAAVRWIKP